MTLLVKTLSFEFDNKAIVFGVHPGIWFPVVSDAGVKGFGAISINDVVSRLIQVLQRVNHSHNGKIIRHTMEVVPP